MLLLDAVRRHEPGRTAHAYSFHAEAPVLVGASVTLRGHRREGATEAVVLDGRERVLARGRADWRDAT